MASTICVGAARNSALATRRRLTSSHNVRPPMTDRAPGRYLLPTRCHMSVGYLRDAVQEQPIDGEALRHIAQRFQRIDQLVHAQPGNLAGRLEVFALDQVVVGTLDVILFEL